MPLTVEVVPSGSGQLGVLSLRAEAGVVAPDRKSLRIRKAARESRSAGLRLGGIPLSVGRVLDTKGTACTHPVGVQRVSGWLQHRTSGGSCRGWTRRPSRMGDLCFAGLSGAERPYPGTVSKGIVRAWGLGGVRVRTGGDRSG